MRMADKDIISKRVIRRIAVDLATFLLDLSIDPDSLELIETERHRIEERRADLVARVRGSIDDREFIMHIEIQSTNHPLMAWRMLRYRTDIALDHPGRLVRQYLIYIGTDRLKMPAGIDQEGLDYRYAVIDMRILDCSSLLARDDPDALVLAVRNRLDPPAFSPSPPPSPQGARGSREGGSKRLRRCCVILADAIHKRSSTTSWCG